MTYGLYKKKEKRKKKGFVYGNAVRKMHCEFEDNVLKEDSTMHCFGDIPYTLCTYTLVDLVWVHIKVWVLKI